MGRARRPAPVFVARRFTRRFSSRKNNSERNWVVCGGRLFVGRRLVTSRVEAALLGAADGWAVAMFAQGLPEFPGEKVS